MVNSYDSMMGGPDINGSWYNKRTGQTVFIRDSFMDDSGMQFITSTGEMIDGEEFSRDYIQCDATVYDENGNSTGQQEAVDYEAMFAGSVQETPKSPTYSDIMGSPLPTTGFSNEEPMPVANKKHEMLKTMFDKLQSLPSVSASIKWRNIPKSELKMLKTYFDIDIEDIADYIYDKYCTPVEVKKAICVSITQLLNKNDK